MYRLIRLHAGLGLGTSGLDYKTDRKSHEELIGMKKNDPDLCIEVVYVNNCVTFADENLRNS